jgi:hypothetical protein
MLFVFSLSFAPLQRGEREWSALVDAAAGCGDFVRAFELATAMAPHKVRFLLFVLVVCDWRGSC